MKPLSRGEQTTVRKRLAVLQALADHEPDVDAIFRLIIGTPRNFKRPKNDADILVVPSDSYSPFNAQATLHYREAFFALFLPVSLSGRVSDIWRAYIAQAMFKVLGGMRLAFMTRPIVAQQRNNHRAEFFPIGGSGGRRRIKKTIKAASRGSYGMNFFLPRMTVWPMRFRRGLNSLLHPSPSFRYRR